MLASDYASPHGLQAKLDGYFREAKRRGWLNKKSVVVLPEYLGAWLVVAGEKRGVYTSPSADRALKLLVVSNLPRVAWAAILSPSPDRLKYAVFRIKAESMAQAYDRVLSDLAHKYQVTIVGGSIILPSPSVAGGKLKAGSGPLYNISPVYLPNGAASPTLVVKTFLTKEEKSWLKAGRVEDLPVFDTSVGKVGVLICADSWFPSSYEVMKRKNAAVVVVASYGIGDHSLQKVWAGYSGQPCPKDVRSADIGSITEKQAWLKYAFPGRLPDSGIPTGMGVCLRGSLWDLGSDGTVVVVRNGKVSAAPFVDGAGIVNLWL
jgi:hypothetical protein